MTGDRVGGLLAVAVVALVGAAIVVAGRAVALRVERLVEAWLRTRAAPVPPVELSAAELRLLRDALSEAMLAHHQQLAAALRGDARAAALAHRAAGIWAREALRVQQRVEEKST